MLTWRSGGSVKLDSIFRLKPPKLSLSLLNSLALIIVMLSLLALLRFLIPINYSARLICKAPKSSHITPLLCDLHWLPISSQIQYKIALICFHIVSGTAPPHFFWLLNLTLLLVLAQILGYFVFLGWAGGAGGEILSIHRSCDLELSSSLCQAFIFTLFFKSKFKLKTHLFPSAY